MLSNLFKNKTLLYGGGIMVLVIFFLVLRSGAGGSSASVAPATAGPSDAQIQASTQLALAQLSGAQQANATNAQLTAAQLQLQEQLAEKTIEADVSKYAIAQDSANQTQQIQANNSQQKYLADLQASVAKWTLDASVAQTQSNNSFQLDYAKASSASAEALATIQAGVINNQILASRDTTIATLEATAAQTASYINGQVAVALSSDQKDISVANINAGVAKHGQTTGLIGGIVGGILGIFSDERLKEDIQLIGRENDGLGIYSYRYRGEREYQVGVMAQEVRKLRPGAIGPRVAGFLTVNYGALATA